MGDELLPYYNRELAFIRRLGAEFADANPGKAGALRIGADSCEDPHVERMIEAFAYLNARIRHKIDDDFPEITDALLGVLYPHYAAPIPAMSIVQFSLDRGQASRTTAYTVPRGAALETEPVDGEPCRFRTAYPVDLWPIEVTAASFQKLPFAKPGSAWPPHAVASLRIELRCMVKDMTFRKLGLSTLRFFIKGQKQHIFALYEAMLNNTVEVFAATGPNDPAPFRLGKTCLQPVGFEADEGLLPYSARSFLGYRLLTEYFAFPEKFLFVDLTLRPEALARIGSQLELTLFVNRWSAELEQNVSVDTLRLGCTPMVNLFKQRAEPIHLTHTETEYRVVPDARRPRATEVYSVESVTGSSGEGSTMEYVPFYSLQHAGDRPEEPTAFWYASRRAAVRTGGQPDDGTEVFLSLVDLEFKPSLAADWIVDVETVCLNRDLPRILPFGGGQPRLQLVDGGPVARAECLLQPTPTLRPPAGQRAMWRVISHLTLNHSSLVDPSKDSVGRPDALREILKLYDFADSGDTRAKIAGVVDVRSRRVVGRAGGATAGGFCRGVEIIVRFDEDRFPDNATFLFASVLERFFGLYCSINSFSQFIARTEQREGDMRRWPPRAAQRTLL